VPASQGGAMFRRFRWLMILLPVVLVTGAEVVSDSVLDIAFPIPLDILATALVILALSAAFSYVTFGRVDALASALEGRNEELERRSARSAALHRVSMAITGLADVDDVLTTVATQARALLDADVGALFVTGPDGLLATRAWDGPPGGVAPAPTDAGDPVTAIRADLAVAHLAAPLQRGGETIGLLVAAASTPRPFDVDDVETLSSLAAQAALAIENDRLQRTLRDLAVVAERERIAREMHDGLAQVLGYVNTKSQAVTELLAAGRVADAQAQLDELAAAARSVYVDVREAIVGLRSPIGPDTRLADAIEDHAGRFAEMAKVAVVVEASPEARTLDLPPGVAAELFRIVQEALTNVRKHAAANRVRISLTASHDDLRIVVADDGRGLASDPPATGDDDGSWPRYGLDTMRERAAAVGATVAWGGRRDRGTEVRIDVPLRPGPAATGTAAGGASASTRTAAGGASTGTVAARA
jgi:signal transduction histidine kinase